MIYNGRFGFGRIGFVSRVAAVVLVLGISASIGSVASAADDPDITVAPRKLIQDTVVKIVAILENDSESTETRVAKIQAIAYDIFDFTKMSKLALGRNWRKIDKEQRIQFVREFKRYLSKTYGTRLDRFDQVNIEVIGTQVEKRGLVSVKTRVVGGKFDGVVISYLMLERSERWRIVNVFLDGISLATTYRDEYTEFLSKGTFDGLLAMMRDKNSKLDEGS